MDPKIRDVVTAMPVVASRVKYQQEVAKKKEKQEEVEFRERVRLAAQNTARRVRIAACDGVRSGGYGSGFGMRLSFLHSFFDWNCVRVTVCVCVCVCARGGGGGVVFFCLEFFWGF